MKSWQFLLALLITLAAAIFAGCESPAVTPGYSGDAVIGTWDWMHTGATAGIQASYSFSADGTFTRADRHDSVIDTYSGTWSKPDSTTYALVYKGKNPGFDSENLYYMNQTGRLRNDSNDFFERVM